MTETHAEGTLDLEIVDIRDETGTERTQGSAFRSASKVQHGREE